MASLKTWLQAARLRTLPLAASGILCGAALAWHLGAFSWLVSGLALLTALLLQILSNFANDYGDFAKGTDNAARVGPQRTMQSGAITAPQMKRGMALMAFFALCSGVGLIFMALSVLSAAAWIIFGVLGVLAIAAAVMYTVGARAYGYRGLGDLMVFIFFGLVGVMGTYYLNTGTLSLASWLIAIGIGTLSTGVLNLNNMRDIDNDLVSGKMTLAARLGFREAKIYHSTLIVLSVLCFVGVVVLFSLKIWALVVLLPPVLLLFKDLQQINRTAKKAALDPFLKKLSLSTFFISLMFILSLLIGG